MMRLKLKTSCTNFRAFMEGPGNKESATNYPNFKPFTPGEIDIYLGILLSNGINIKPQLEFWFHSPPTHKVYGSDYIEHYFPRDKTRLKEFKRFFCLYDPRIHPKATDGSHFMLGGVVLRAVITSI